MKNKIFLMMLMGAILMTTSCQQKEKQMQAPDAEKKPKELTIHGDTRTDNYYWLNERENPEVIDYLEAENAYTQAKLEDTEKLQEKLFNEITARIKPNDESVPYFLNGYWYKRRFNEGDEHPVFIRKKEKNSDEEEVLLDGNKMAEGLAYFNIGSFAVSEDNNFLAYSTDTVSRRKYTIYIKDLRTGEILEDRIPNTTGTVVWGGDNKTLFYTVKDETLRPYRIYKHVTGQPSENDELIFEESDATFTCDVRKSKSRKYIFIDSESTVSNETRFVDANHPEKEFKVLQPRERGLEYVVAHHHDHFYILTNQDALNFRVMKTPVEQTTKENWQEVIPHRKDVLLEDLILFEDFMVLEERVEGLSEIRIRTLDGTSDFHIPFDEKVYTAYAGYNPDFYTGKLRFRYTSLTTPPKTIEYDLESDEQTVLKETEVLGGYHANDYQAERFFATAEDGTKIPVSLVYKKSELDKPMPLLLYAYGSYGSSMDPYFSYSRVSLLNRGFAFAVAHIRGGQEMGRQWYEDGKMLNKKNTFTDFNDVAEHLISENYTTPDQLFAMGGSAGGLLMGAIVNMKPELYKGVIAAVPFVDVVTTMLDESIPLTTGEFDEWGNPKDKEYYDYILSYSPYDNVKKQDYPAMLVTTGLHDSQVQYWEPAKWVAKLRDMKTDDNLLLLHTNMDFGHSGASGRYAAYKETAMEYAFILKVLKE
jgi:oligopeptidase B